MTSNVVLELFIKIYSLNDYCELGIIMAPSYTPVSQTD